MIIEGYDKFPFEEFGGGNERGERSDVKPDWAIEASNVEFEPGFLRTRRGFYATTDADLNDSLAVGGAYNHLYAGKSYFIRSVRSPGSAISASICQYDGTAGGVGLASYSTSTPGYGSYAGFGKRIYVAHGNAAQTTGKLGVIDVTAPSTAFGVWMPPITLATIAAGLGLSPSGAGTGKVNQGPHGYYLLFQSKTGFVTRLGPVSAVTEGIPGAFAVYDAGVNNYALTITITAPGGGWPTDLAAVYLVATTTTNLSKKYIVPNSKNTITSSGQTLSFVFDMADVTLATMPTTDQYESYVYTGLGIGAASTDQPIKPYYCFQAGERLGLFFEDDLGPAMAFSEPNAYEAFALDRNVIRLPGLKRPIAGKWTQHSIYIFAEDSTYSFTDTGGYPVTWPKPGTIDSKIGTLVPTGITLDTSGNGAVAHTTGLYMFSGGQYDQVPISFFQPTTWKKVNWGDPSISLCDDKENYRLVMGFKDFNNVRHLVSWNYMRGTDAQAVKFSEYFFDGCPSGYFPVWATIVTNYGDANSSSYRKQLWLQQGTYGQWILNRDSLDANPYQDSWYNGSTVTTTGIAVQRYRLAYLPPRPKDLQIYQHAFGVLRIVGSGSYRYKAYGLDDSQVVTVSDTSGNPINLVLSASPGKELVVAYQLISEMASVELINQSTSPGTYFALSYWCHYSKFYSARRGS